MWNVHYVTCGGVPMVGRFLSQGASILFADLTGARIVRSDFVSV